MRKIRRTPGGRLVGAAGRTCACAVILDWLEAGEVGPCPLDLSGNSWSDIILVEPDGRVFVWGESGKYQVHDKRVAVGSGMAYALGAMASGKSAADAIKVAALFDPGTGRGVDSLPLRPRR